MTENYGRFTFRYCHDVDSPGRVRIYVESQPSYQGRPDGGSSTHRLTSGGGAPTHICIKDECKPASLSAAQSLAHRWANATERYIATGRFG